MNIIRIIISALFYWAVCSFCSETIFEIASNYFSSFKSYFFSIEPVFHFLSASISACVYLSNSSSESSIS